MTCNTCQQNNVATINGRYFCANCGKKAAERLKRFTPQSQHETTVNVLDLNQQQPKNSLKQSLGGMHARGLHHKSQVSEMVKQTEVVQAEPLETPEPVPQVPAQPERPQAPEPTPEPAPLPESTPEPTAPMPTKPPKTANGPTTVMEPHLTYPLKDPSTFEEVNQPVIADHDFASINEPVVAPAKKHNRKAFYQRFNPFSNMAVKVGTVALSILLLAGYVTYLNYPNIAVRVAASRANMQATLPEYTPDGYRFSGPIAYGPGKLTVTFRRGDNTMMISQAVTQWDSQSLLEDYVKLQTSRYETYRENGLTIYTYGNRYAVWVNGGIMYQIEADGHINVGDIVKMASSL